MRITSGKHKGRVLYAPTSLPVRPTTDFAKQALFNILTNTIDLKKICFLDLFAGTGNISYEMASRGCNSITCVDLQADCINYIKETAFKLNINGIACYTTDVAHFLKSNTNKFDVIFADPPFDFEKIIEIPNWIFESKVLAKNGIFILEHFSKIKFTNYSELYNERNYGKLNFSFFKSPT